MSEEKKEEGTKGRRFSPMACPRILRRRESDQPLFPEGKWLSAKRESRMKEKESEREREAEEEEKSEMYVYEREKAVYWAIFPGDAVTSSENADLRTLRRLKFDPERDLLLETREGKTNEPELVLRDFAKSYGFFWRYNLFICFAIGTTRQNV
ncbi:hypothetical protein PUN28_007104 [Cardiocondyla obscurior]|uniref:Uncharacterized protein n=1 Tax=Cardiocondyla obscurior TaxID=286306 RepID=A0AAW2G7S1_9HYME